MTDQLDVQCELERRAIARSFEIAQAIAARWQPRPVPCRDHDWAARPGVWRCLACGAEEPR